MATQHERQQQPVHILFFPFFAPGHLLPAADVAAVFAARGARCTILTTPVNADIIRPAVDRANDANNLHGTGSRTIDISLMPFPDVGIPPGVENYMALATLQVDCRVKFMRAVQLVQEPFHRFLADNRPNGVVSDSFFNWSADAAAEHGVPRLVFIGTSVFARSFNESMLRNNTLETTTSEDDPETLVSLPGLPHRVQLRRSQMMDPRKQPGAWAFYQSNNAADQRSFGEVFNSFYELEPDYVEHFQTTLGRRAFLVGPVALATRGMAANGANVNADVNKDSCLRWLDTKPAGSVVYVSFGTTTRFSPVELREISRGLDFSGKNFVWAISAGEGTKSSEWLPEGFAELTANIDDSRGLVIRGWAPQTLILNHPALGGFMTHCGWNSVLEVVSAGVPMVTWPRIGARDYASPIENHEVIGGEVIAGSIAALMGNSEQGDAIRKKTRELGMMARSAVQKGGSSYSDIGRLMEELIAHRRCSVKVGEDVSTWALG
ncbi:hypothetical protein ACQ4PT_067185 [Festuca glaucescens]